MIEVTRSGEVSGQNSSRGSLSEIFWAFLKLGLTSFGGPIAHLGYFREAFVVRRRWIDEAGYADLVALCQFLPGPASSQVGFALGVRRGGGILGGVVAWLAFTLPSALVLLAFAMGAAAFSDGVIDGALHGLKLVAVAVVAQAVWGMSRNLTPDWPRALIALSAALLALLSSTALSQIGAIALGACAGLVLCRDRAVAIPGELHFPVKRRQGVMALALFAACFFIPPTLLHLTHVPALALFDGFFRSGALVFGGGHVVLPLLQVEVAGPGGFDNAAFLAGYGLAQAVPGPLFSFAAYLGAMMPLPPTGVAGSAIALVAIFLPGLLLVYGALPFWDALRRSPAMQAAVRGTNAAVVGILAAALYSPIGTSAILAPRDAVLALAGFLLLTVGKAPSWLIVLLLAATGLVMAQD